MILRTYGFRRLWQGSSRVSVYSLVGGLMGNPRPVLVCFGLMATVDGP